MANYGVFGYIKTPSGNIVTNAKVYPYFKKVSSAAPSSKWSDVPYLVSNLGYYSFNLGDNSLIGTESNIVKGQDKIYLAVVWNENNVSDQNMNSLTFTHCLFIEHTTINEEFVEINLTIEPKRLPILDNVTFSSTNLLTRTNYTISEKSHADYSWKSIAPYQDTQISQKLMFDLLPIFDGHQMINTIYDWGEKTNIISNSSSNTYQYDIAGVYNTCVTVREKWNTEVKVCQSVTVKYNKPIADFDWLPILTNSWEGSKLKGTELITFNNKCYDVDNRTFDINKWGIEAYKYEWIIEDTLIDGSDNTKTYTDVNYNYKPQHQFQSPGNKNITLKIFWNDGFDDYIETITKVISIHPFNIVPNFEWDRIPQNRDDVVTFTSTTTGDTYNILQYEWNITDQYPASIEDLKTFEVSESSIFGEGSVNPEVLVNNDYNIINDASNKKASVKFHNPKQQSITLTITYFDGWINQTKTISKNLTPAKYNVIPSFYVSNLSPKGRHEIVTFTNTTNYIRDIFNLAYSVDWDINDFYSKYNLDNPNMGQITDNSVAIKDVSYSKIQSHNFQNTDNNSVILTIRYDDGYQMQTKRTIHVVTPIVFTGIVPQFTFNTPSSRFDRVTIKNTTIDIDYRFRSLTFTVNDHYNKFNPDNPDYKISITNNNKVYSTNNKNEEFYHFYQDNTTENIELLYYYDDGFEEQVVSKTNIINKITNDIEVEFDTDIVPISNCFVGKQEIIFTNISLENNIKIEDEKWTWNDKLMDNTDNFTIRNDQIPFGNQPFTFMTPSRLPFSSKEWILQAKPNQKNYNKEVTLEVRIDNGWRNDTENGNVDDTNNYEDGGQVYFSLKKIYEASPNELTSFISVKTNINTYKH